MHFPHIFLHDKYTSTASFRLLYVILFLIAEGGVPIANQWYLKYG
jgi:hypothetical protein